MKIINRIIIIIIPNFVLKLNNEKTLFTLLKVNVYFLIFSIIVILLLFLKFSIKILGYKIVYINI